MKKSLIIVALLIGVLFASKVSAQVSLHVGYAPEAWVSSNSTVTLNSVFVGGTYNLNLSGALDIALGAQLRYGTETGNSSLYGLVSAKHTSTLVGLDIPILLNYTFRLSGGLGLSLFIGPKFSYNFSGKTKYDGNVLGFSSSTEYDWFDQNQGNLKPFNAALTCGATFSYKQFRIFGGYSYGLTDVSPNNNTTTVGGPFFGLGMGL